MIEIFPCIKKCLDTCLKCRLHRQSTKELLKGYVGLPLFPGKGGDNGFNVGYSLLNLIENHIWLPKFLYPWITNTSYRTIISNLCWFSECRLCIRYQYQLFRSYFFRFRNETAWVAHPSAPQAYNFASPITGARPTNKLSGSLFNLGLKCTFLLEWLLGVLRDSLTYDRRSLNL